MSPRKPQICAHAGAENTSPNSLDSVIAGIQAGADWVELDLRFSPRGTPVVSHDWPGARSTAGLLTLAVALEALGRHPSVGINVDVKEWDRIRDLPPALTQGELANPTYFTGLGRRSSRYFRAVWPKADVACNQLPVGYAWRSFASKVAALRTMKAGGVSWLNLPFTVVDEALMKASGEADIPVRVWTVDRDDDLRRMISLGVDVITTNRPRRLKELLR